jgi:molybdenum cofactor cytidylyltransferase
MRLTRALRLQHGDVVTLVGGGGKTTLMFALATDVTRLGWRVVTTMTTHIFAGQTVHAPTVLTLADLDTPDAPLASVLAAGNHVLVVGGAADEPDRLQGIAPEQVDRIAALDFVDAVIIEGDGARRLPFKAPAAHEPVIPAATTLLIPMAGLDVIGRPLTAEYVHRPALVARLTGVEEGAAVTPDMVARALAHPDGGAKSRPAGARLVPFLNKADDTAKLEAGRAVARSLLVQPKVDSITIGALKGPELVREVWSRVGVVVLAGGEARRFGALKQLALWRGKPLVAYTTAQAAGCADVCCIVVTTGAGADEVGAAVAGEGVQVVHTPDWAAGQSRSVQAGLAGLLAVEPRLGAAIFMMADQPGVTPALLSALIERHRETLAPAVAPRYAGRRGAPVLFDRATFDEFAALRGDLGGRPIIAAHMDEVAWLDWPTPEVIQDIDTPEDYHRAAGS